MNTPGWLAALGLLLWGVAAGHAGVGALLATGLGVAASGRLHFAVDDAALDRSADLGLLATLAVGVGFLVVDGLPQGLLHAIGWLPVALLPLLVAALFGAASGTPLRFRHLAHLLRRRDFPEAETPLDAAAAYLALTLLAAGTLAAPAAWFFPSAAALVLLWLFVGARPQGTPRRLAFAAAALAALLLGLVVDRGLERAHQSLQQWVIDTLAGIDIDPDQSQTRIGDLGQVKLAEGIVWRVEQRPPVTVPLRLRNGVFTRFDGSLWRARRNVFAPLPEAAAAANEPARLRLRGSSRHGQALLPLPLGNGSLRLLGAGPAARLASNPYGVVRLVDAAPPIELRLAGAPWPLPPPDADDLALPPAYRGLLDRLPELAGLRQQNDAARLAGLEAWFAEHFRYTLALGNEAAATRSLDDFLHRDRAGHCEYFASATTLLLRALGIPARYVTGYSVQEFSRLEKAFVVRQRHAHAWVEAWVDGRWVEVDTTPSTWLAAEEQRAPFWQPLADLIAFAADRFGDWRRGLAADDLRLPAALLAAVALGWIVWRGRRRLHLVSTSGGTAGDAEAAAAPPELVVFRELERELAAAGLPRNAAETPRNWLRRIAREGGGAVSKLRLDEAQRTVETLYRSRYTGVDRHRHAP